MHNRDNTFSKKVIWNPREVGTLPEGREIAAAWELPQLEGRVVNEA
jgi:hypothetical protein